MCKSEDKERPFIFERDIDALLERRLRSDQRFAGFLINEIARQSGTSIPYEELIVKRQAPHEGTRGSIDLLVRLLTKDSGETSRLLIENKLNSAFTPSQPDRYLASADAMSQAHCRSITVLCAPNAYPRKHATHFSAVISYEQLAQWVCGDDLILIQQAIQRFVTPYDPVPADKVTIFHKDYRELARQIAPELVVKSNPNTNGARPKDSHTIYFDTGKSLPRWRFLPTLRFSHQCRDSGARSPSAKVMFAGWAAHENLLRGLSCAVLRGTGLYLRKAGRSLGLVHDTPPMDNMRSVCDQTDAVSAGIRAAAALRAWMFQNEATLREWAERVEGFGA